MPADCALEVHGEQCGVAAVGRCTTCGLAFCPTHQGEVLSVNWTYQEIMTGDTDRRDEPRFHRSLCRTCAIKSLPKDDGSRQAAMVSQREREDAPRRRIAAALDALEAAGRPGLIVNQKQTGWERRAFRRDRPIMADLPGVWPVGDCTWNWPDTHSEGGGRRPAPSAIEADTGRLVALIHGRGLHAVEQSVPGLSGIAAHLEATVARHVTGAHAHPEAGSRYPALWYGDRRSFSGKHVRRIVRL